MLILPPRPVGNSQTEVDNDTTNERTKATRHPRWTIWETLVLIEAKKVVENGGKPACPSGFNSIQFEPKWDLVSSFCERQGVNRGPVQCRKRYSSLLSDFKKIQKWESDIKVEGESFWMMRNDELKERKLPSYFDWEVFKVLDGKVTTAGACPLARIKTTSEGKNADGDDDDVGKDEEEEAEVEAEATVDGEKMGWNWSKEEETIETNTATKKVTTFLNVAGTEEITMAGTAPMPTSGNYPDSDYTGEPASQEGSKRKRSSPENCEDTTHFSNRFIKVVRRNSDILNAHREAQNMNYQLSREQQKEQSDSLVAALGKLTDALTKIADKL
ncbi:hypothetical protein L6164_014926 [Bauhinia variegata]|uniref:Uncharacterized protein n=1 Tax=Bauhinia variegata TaxID=167791 RepID=A0ACB9NK39_BAUVA|nr:hypothetical protein L6164_014926 [Bauhinia variegata]